MALVEFAASSPSGKLEAAPGGAKSGVSTEVEKNAAFLFEMIVADLHWTSIQIAALCISATVCAPVKARWSLRSCRHLLYDDTGVMRLALRYGVDVGLTQDTPRTLDRLYAELSEIRTRLSPLAETAPLSKLQREQLSRLVPQLRRLAATAISELMKIETLARGRLNANYLDDCVTIRQFLDRAAKGDTADFDQYGVVGAPRLKQRRHSPRVPLEKPCRLALPEGESDAKLLNVSREGLGLSCSAPLAPGQDLVVVIVEDGRRLKASVARRNGNQLGLTLATRLPFTDPLFQGD